VLLLLMLVLLEFSGPLRRDSHWGHRQVTPSTIALQLPIHAKPTLLLRKLLLLSHSTMPTSGTRLLGKRAGPSHYRGPNRRWERCHAWSQ